MQGAGLMRNVCITICRVALSAWVGAAVLFVITAVAEVRSASLSSEIKSTLALLRFPHYYRFGFVLLTAALIGGLGLWTHPGMSRRRAGLVWALLAAALSLMTADYFWVYRPMVEMLSDLQSPRPAAFQTLHMVSQIVNAVDLGLCLVAAWVVCWPTKFANTSAGE